MAETFTTELGNAIETIIKAQGATYIQGFAPRNVFFYHDDEVIQGGQCPAIGILFRGWNRVKDSCRGHNADGTVASGYALMDFRFDVHIWQSASKPGTLESLIKKWADGVTAILEDQYSLGGESVDVKVDATNQLEQLEIGGNLLAVMPINLSISCFRLQGAVTLP